jgi:hypothetical protein
MTLVPVESTTPTVPIASSRDKVLRLYGLGISTARIARMLDLSGSRVTAIIREEISCVMQRVGTEEIRIALAADLELVRHRLMTSILDAEDGVPPSKSDVASLVRLTRQEAILVGASTPGAIVVSLPVQESEADMSWLDGLVEYQRRREAVEAGTHVWDPQTGDLNPLPLCGGCHQPMDGGDASGSVETVPVPQSTPAYDGPTASALLD